MLQYMLWKREHYQNEMSEHRHDVKSKIKSQAFIKQALVHFETLRGCTFSEKDNMNAFILLHYEVFVKVCTLKYTCIPLCSLLGL